ncbi:hypothetical protein FRB95_013463, partial [Tulasnella sp. JGI-2019a]
FTNPAVGKAFEEEDGGRFDKIQHRYEVGTVTPSQATYDDYQVELAMADLKLEVAMTK